MLTRRRHDCTVEGETAMSEDKPQPDHERDILAACEILRRIAKAAQIAEVQPPTCRPCNGELQQAMASGTTATAMLLPSPASHPSASDSQAASCLSSELTSRWTLPLSNKRIPRAVDATPSCVEKPRRDLMLPPAERQAFCQRAVRR